MYVEVNIYAHFLKKQLFLDLTVMQCSVNKIFHCISSDYLMAAGMAVSVYSVNFSSKTPGARPVTGARDKPLRHVHSCRKHKFVKGFCCWFYLACVAGVKRGRGRQSADGRRRA